LAQDEAALLHRALLPDIMPPGEEKARHVMDAVLALQANLTQLWRPESVFEGTERFGFERAPNGVGEAAFARCTSVESVKAGAFLAHRVSVLRSPFADSRAKKGVIASK
jgi:hypothetical protein